MGNRSYVAANSGGPSNARDGRDPAKDEYWVGKGPWLRAGACAYRANLALTEHPEEYEEVVRNIKRWLKDSAGHSDGTYHLSVDLELQYAQRYVCWKGDDYVRKTSAPLWDLVATDFIRVLDVMES